MEKKQSRPGAIHLRIVDVLRRYPDGASGGQIRQDLENAGLKPEDHTHLDRRKRDLKKWFVIEKIKTSQQSGGTKRIVTLYKYIGEKTSIIDGRGKSAKKSEHRYFMRLVDVANNVGRVYRVTESL